MNRILVAATFAFSLFALPTILAQTQTETQSQNCARPRDYGQQGR